MPRPLRYRCEFTIRATPEERARLEARAKAAGLSLSRYLVEAGLTTTLPGAAERALRERTLFHVRKVGVNLNQIARRLNSQAPVAEEELVRALSALRAALGALLGTEEAS